MVQAKSKQVAVPDAAAACAAWQELVQALGPISAAQTTENARNMMRIVDLLLDHIGEGGPAGASRGMLDFFTVWVEEHERANVPIPEADPAELICFLMKSNGLVQKDLAPLLGGQSCVSAVLNRKRQVNARQAIALGQRFSMSPAAFIGVNTPPSQHDHVRVGSTSGPSVDIQAERLLSRNAVAGLKTYEPTYTPAQVH